MTAMMNLVICVLTMGPDALRIVALALYNVNLAREIQRTRDFLHTDRKKGRFSGFERPAWEAPRVQRGNVHAAPTVGWPPS